MSRYRGLNPISRIIKGRPRGRVTSTVWAARPCKREKVTQNLYYPV
jgi:hypothetical protein